MKNWSEFTCFQTSIGAVWGGLFLTTDKSAYLSVCVAVASAHANC